MDVSSRWKLFRSSPAKKSGSPVIRFTRLRQLELPTGWTFGYSYRKAETCKACVPRPFYIEDVMGERELITPWRVKTHKKPHRVFRTAMRTDCTVWANRGFTVTSPSGRSITLARAFGSTKARFIDWLLVRLADKPLKLKTGFVFTGRLPRRVVAWLRGEVKNSGLTREERSLLRSKNRDYGAIARTNRRAEVFRPGAPTTRHVVFATDSDLESFQVAEARLRWHRRRQRERRRLQRVDAIAAFVSSCVWWTFWLVLVCVLVAVIWH